MRLLVTAAGGLVGPSLTHAFSSAGHEVCGLYRDRIPDAVAALAKAGGCRLHRADLSVGIDLDWAADVIVHNAGESPRPGEDGLAGTQRFGGSNIRGTANVIEWARAHAIPKLVYFSGLSVYGRVTDAVIDERTRCVDPEPYGASKLAAEHLLDEAKDDLASVALRLPGILAVGSDDRIWLGRILGQARRGDDIVFYNSAAPFNNAIASDDIAGLVMTVADRMVERADILTLGAREPMTIADVVHVIVASAGSRSNVIDAGFRPGAFRISTQKAERDYGFVPRPMRALLDTFIRDQSRPDSR